MTVSALSRFKLDRACKITRDLVAKNPLTPDYSSDYMAVQAWPFVIALYSGAEQALKLLLLAQPNPQFTLDDLTRWPYRHDLEKLYAALPADDRDHIELHFREHWSLYDYDTYGRVICTAEDFIAHINRGGKQGGSVSWRYVLVDETVKIPPTSLWTMCEIWSAVCCRVKAKALDRQGDCFRLSRMLAFKSERIVFYRVVPYDDFMGDAQSWIGCYNGGLLAAWLDLLVKASHGTMHEVPASERLRHDLANQSQRVIEQMSAAPNNPDETQLLHRIQTDPNLTWDRTTATFGLTITDPDDVEDCRQLQR